MKEWWQEEMKNKFTKVKFDDDVNEILNMRVSQGHDDGSRRFVSIDCQ